MHSVGLTLGKFAPLHGGHELMLSVAADNCDELIVLLDNPTNPFIPYDIRYNWVDDFLRTKMDIHDFTIYPDNGYTSDYTMDEHGTITDEQFWNDWLEQHRDTFKNVDVVFTSDRYGQEIAKHIGATWFPVDPDREVINISATEIRSDVKKNWKYISDHAKPDMGHTVAVVGAESTGKSTMTKLLAGQFGTTYAPEYGRIICEAKPELSHKDFSTIYDMQEKFIKYAQVNGNGVCFTDTEAITTSLFAPIYLDRDHIYGAMRTNRQKIDLYLVLAPTVPMVQDGTRTLTLEERQTFHDDLINELKQRNKHYVVIDAVDYADRYWAAHDAVIKYLRNQEGWYK
jgi:HTH-type transcriptional repressor of NAD biosynthesis genes